MNLPEGIHKRAEELVRAAYEELQKEFPQTKPVRIFLILQSYCEKFKWWWLR